MTRVRLPFVALLVLASVVLSNLGCLAQMNGGGRQQIAFVGSMGGTEQVYLINEDGTGLRKLTAIRQPMDPDLTPYYIDSLCWSPDGSKLAFFQGSCHKRLEGLWFRALWTVQADGTDLRMLRAWEQKKGDLPYFEEYPPALWAPDGQSLIFCWKRGENGGGPFIYQLPIAAPKAGRVLVKDAIYPASDYVGSRLAYVKPGRDDDDGVRRGEGVWTCRLDGTGQRRLASVDGSYHERPTWSPDGSMLAFWCWGMDRDSIELLQVDRRRERTLTTGCSLHYQCPWSPDSKWLVACGQDGVYVIDLTTGAPRRVLSATRDQEAIDQCEWSPDGRSLVFARSREVGGAGGGWDWASNIGIINADGSDKRQLVKEGHSPTWRPMH